MRRISVWGSWVLMIFMCIAVMESAVGQQENQQPQQPQSPQVQTPQVQPPSPQLVNEGQAVGAGAAAQATSLDKRLDYPINVSNVDLRNVLQILQQESGVQMVLGGDLNKNVTFSLENPSVREVLDTVLPANGLDYFVQESGVILIDTLEKIMQLKMPVDEIIERIFSPQYIDVTELQGAIESTLSPNGTVIIHPDSQKIIVRDVPAAVEAIQQLILSLDVPTDTRVFTIRYANAEEIAEQLVGVINTVEGELFVDYRNNRIIITDTPDRLDRAAAIIQQLDIELEFVVVPLAFALPEDIMPLIEGLLTETGYVDFDPRTSRLFIQDIPSVIEQILRLIKMFDISPQQVYIEADIVQVNNDKNLTMGTTLAIGKDIGLGGNPSAPNVGNVTGGSAGNFFSFNPFLTTSGSGLTLLDVTRGNYRLQIDAMVEKRLAEVIASPRLLVQDGGFGAFTLGSQEPFASRQQSYYGGYGGLGGGGDYFTQQFREVGTRLELEVYASEAGYVELYINVEDTRPRRVQLANVGEALAVDGSFIDTSVTVKSGRTVVLGGIINRRNEESRSGVPVLSSIPVLGTLFRTKSSNSTKQKLLIFITPTIVSVDDPYEFAQIDNVSRIQDLQSKGATKFIETPVDERFLDWSNEEPFQDAAIEDAMKRQGIRANGSNAQRVENTNERKPSPKEQMNSGIIRRYQKR